MKRSGPQEERARRAWLKEQGLGGAQAWFVAERSMGKSAHAFDDTPEGYLTLAPQYVDRQYAGRKAALRPLYEALLDLAFALGPDVKACPCETIVPLYRQRVFAQIKPATLSRVDLLLALGDPRKVQDPEGRLLDTGGFAKKDRLTHRLEVKALPDLDASLKKWLKAAYEADA
ncbi:MAG: hypothetical protein HY823_03445 [Acidobacteria bacterium]|nr:hypothetical protein [Acidobacteriota bacterium]